MYNANNVAAKFSRNAKIKYTKFYLIDLHSSGLMCVKIFISFCQVLKKMHTKENWFLFSASLCRITGIHLLIIY